MRLSMAEAMHASRSAARRTKSADDKSQKFAAINPPPTLHAMPADGESASSRKTEFDQRPSTTRLNDVALAPPSLTKLPRGASENKGQTVLATGEAAGVLSMARRQIIEAERERAIKRYRELKEARNTVWTDLGCL